MPLPDEVRLRHMLDAALKVRRFAQGRIRADLDHDEMYFLATLRLIEIIGEAASAITLGFKDAHAQIPWRLVSGTRNRLIHGYFDVNRDIVWQIVTTDLPVLEKILSPPAAPPAQTPPRIP